MRLVLGKKLCTICCKQLSRLATPCTSPKHDSDIDVEGDGEVEKASNSDSCDEEDASTQYSALLVSINESPIRKHRMHVKRNADDKMRRIEEGIRKTL